MNDFDRLCETRNGPHTVICVQNLREQQRSIIQATKAIFHNTTKAMIITLHHVISSAIISKSYATSKDFFTYHARTFLWAQSLVPQDDLNCSSFLKYFFEVCYKKSARTDICKTLCKKCIHPQISIRADFFKNPHKIQER